MKSTTVNEQQALAQLDKVLERDIKRLHIGLAVRLKNKLTPEQQEQLHKMRMERHMGIPKGLVIRDNLFSNYSRAKKVT